ncbi:hypothetical protein O7606_12330 [Micromonospora sp. WMMD882]|uniref:hypothetical protein n=1 Tax=Micromonospora sp. WMMD882 TaxID=3015151 RepID=UPI00248AC2F2|nr:hypothetical protein [Micromonospora sp. WMMD882]WBB82077.1 hypothetical protein O7606_12330 [Micromonospora sp. WMMD882]
MSHSPTDRHAYGLRVRGLGHVTELAPAVPPDDRPTLTVRYDHTGPPPQPTGPDRERCARVLADGRRMSVRRDLSTATFHGPAPAPDLLAHPYLAAAAIVVNRWAGRESFHAGAFVSGGRAWAVLGARTAGKSSLLAALAADGVPVLADDVLVTDGRDGFAGPRCLDLREPVPGADLATRPARYATRLRVALPPAPDRLPVGGWFFLRWRDGQPDTAPPGSRRDGGGPAVSPVPASDLLARLAALRTWPELPSDPAVLLALATLPAWDLVRPRGWWALDHTRRLIGRALRAPTEATPVTAPTDAVRPAGATS